MLQRETAGGIASRVPEIHFSRFFRIFPDKESFCE
jgi:hypothetical protein